MTTPRKTPGVRRETPAKGTSENQAETMDKKIETPQRSCPPTGGFRLKVFGIGGAGTNAVRHIAAASGLAARQAREAGRPRKFTRHRRGFWG